MFPTAVEFVPLEALPPPTRPPIEFVIRPAFPIFGSTPGPNHAMQAIRAHRTTSLFTSYVIILTDYQTLIPPAFVTAE